MKKGFLYIGICVLFAGVFMPVGVVFGQTLPTVTICYNASRAVVDCNTPGATRNPPPSAEGGPILLTDVQQDRLGKLNINQRRVYNDAIAQHKSPEEALNAADQALKDATPGGNPTSSATCNFFNLNIGGCFAKMLGFLSYYLIFQLTNLLLIIGGFILNFVINLTIIDMAKNISGMEGINIAWKVMRDIMNIFFIFLLVYEGIILIIGVSNQKRARDFIFGIVLASLLINFSLFFTKIIIDASNVVTIGFYKSILNEDATVNITGSDGKTFASKVGLSNAYMNQLNLQGFFSDKSLADSGGDEYKRLILVLGGSVLFTIVAFVFFATSIMFIVRYVLLIILLMLSPIAYMGMAIPFMKKFQGDWWKTFLGQCMFPPIYMLMTWITLTLIGSRGFLTEQNVSPASWTNLASGNAESMSGSIGLIINFAVIIGLSIASLVIAKQYATQGASQIKDFTGKATAFAGGAVLGGTAMAMRKGLGGAGNSLANSEKLKDAASKGGAKGFAARMILQGGNKAATSSFDVRATDSFGDLSKSTGMNFGKVDPKKANYRAIREEKDKKNETLVKQYKPNDIEYDKAKNNDIMAEKTNKENEKNAQNAVDQAKNNEKKANEEIVKLNDEIKQKKDEANSTFDSKRKTELDEEIKNMKEDVERKKQNLENLRNAVKQKETILNEATETKKNYKKEEDALNEKYQKRADAMADRVENASPVWRYTANSLGSVLNVATGGVFPMPKTKADRKVEALKIRKVPKGKKKLSAKALKDTFGVDFEDNAEDKAKTDEAPKEETPKDDKTT